MKGYFGWQNDYFDDEEPEFQDPPELPKNVKEETLLEKELPNGMTIFVKQNSDGIIVDIYEGDTFKGLEFVDGTWWAWNDLL